ncbi:hypothetical protein ABEV00_19090 [Paenibacillus thiaminolyticus]|uniref:hypothetical protein n=1 Tax=Paenibacillus thiaminolyticus TaxID=49283 RepID=UPI003D266591
MEALRNGGYILYMRHGEATMGQDFPHVIFDDCGTQRNLSEEGKRQARQPSLLDKVGAICIRKIVCCTPLTNANVPAIIPIELFNSSTTVIILLDMEYTS